MDYLEWVIILRLLQCGCLNMSATCALKSLHTNVVALISQVRCKCVVATPVAWPK